MVVCDICKNPSKYETYVIINSKGKGQKMDLCGECYDLLQKEEYKHRALAYEAVATQRTKNKGIIQNDEGNNIF